MATTRKFAADDAKLNVGGIVTSRNKKYIDIDLDFSVNQANGDIFRKRDANAVKCAIRNLLLTNYYERPFQPSFGTGITDLLFELADDITNIQLDKNIRLAIENFEPRARIINLDINSSPDLNSIDITLEFLVVSTQEQATLIITLDRLR